MPHPADWLPDPTERHQHRYWDGSSWTPHVADNGIQSEDPLSQEPPRRKRAPRRERRSAQRPGFVRKPLKLNGSLDAHYFVAMRAKEEGDHAKVINAALDIWEKFGFCWHVADALWDGFLAWEKTTEFERAEAYELSITLYRRARTVLPPDLSRAPWPNHDMQPREDPVRDWVSLFNLTERYFAAIGPRPKSCRPRPTLPS